MKPKERRRVSRYLAEKVIGEEQLILSAGSSRQY
jgi:hypothetical protein